MKKIYLALGLVAGLTLSSCSLDAEPSESLSVDDAITTVSDLQNAVNGIGYLQSEERMTYGAEFAIYADLLTNEFTIADDYGQSKPISNYTMTKYDELPDYAYRYFYRAIANCNKALALSKDLDDEDAESDIRNLRGQLYAWRGLLHFDIARMFAHIPSTVDMDAANSGIVLSTDVYDADYKGSRASLKETYTQIVKDLTTGMEMMYEDNGTGYMNYYAAQALRARAFLYMGDYDSALADAKAVIQSGAYKLYTRDNYLEVWGKEGTSESIFELLITDTHNPQRNSVGYYTDGNGYPECAFNEDGKLYEYLTGPVNDIRGALVKAQSISGMSGTYHFPAKYPGRGMLYVNNPKIIRLSEMYLIAAEAELVGNGDAAAAATYINELRKNRIDGYVDEPSVTIDDIIFEYSKEFFAENQIAFAYWRNKQSVTNQVGNVINYDNPRTIMPIPQREIDYDPSLVQNAGY